MADALIVDEYQLEEGLDSLAQYLDRHADAGTVQIRHQALREWLTETRGVHRVIAVDGHKRLANDGWKQFTHGVPSMSRYSLAHLPHHLLASNDVERLATLLTDLSFLEAQVTAGLLFDLVAHARSAADKLARESQQRGPLLEIADVLTREGAFLYEHPHHLFQCLQNRSAPSWREAGHNPSGVLAGLVQAWRSNGAPGRPWLRTIVRPEASPVSTFRVHSRAVTAAAVLTPRGCEPELVASFAWDGSVALWTATGRWLDHTRFPYNPHMVLTSADAFTTRSYHHATCAAWIEGENLSLITGNTNGSVQVWKVADGQKLEQQSGYLLKLPASSNTGPVPVRCVSASKTGARSAAVFADGQAFLAADGHLDQLRFGDDDPLTCAAFSPVDDSLLVCGSRSGKVRNIRFRNGNWVPWMGRLNAAVSNMAFRPDGRLLFCVTANREVIAVAVDELGEIEVRSPIPLSIQGEPTCLAVTRNGTHLGIAATDGELLLLKVNSEGRMLGQHLVGFLGATCLAACHRDEASFYVGTRSGEIMRIGADQDFSIPPSNTWTAPSQNGTALAVATEDGAVEIHDTFTGEVRHCHRSSLTEIVDGCFYGTHRGAAVATASDEIVTFKLGENVDPDRVRLSGRFAAISGAPRSDLLGVVESEGQLSLWRTCPEMNQLASMPLGWRPSCLGWSLDGAMVAVGGQDARLYRIGDESIKPHGISLLEWLETYDPQRLHNSRVDERWLSEDGLDLRPAGEFVAEALGIASVAIADDCSLLAMGFRSNTVLVLTVPGLEGHDYPIEEYVPPEEMSPNSRWIVGVLFCAMVRSWPSANPTGWCWSSIEERKAGDRSAVAPVWVVGYSTRQLVYFKRHRSRIRRSVDWPRTAPSHFFQNHSNCWD